MLQRRSTARLFSGEGTGVRRFWLPPCVPVVSSAPVSSSPVYADQNTLLTAESRRSSAAAAALRGRVSPPCLDFSAAEVVVSQVASVLLTRRQTFFCIHVFFF